MQVVNLRMDPLKCALEFLLVNSCSSMYIKKKIDLDPTKAKVIQHIEPHKTCKQLKVSIARVYYFSILIPALAELL